MRPRFGILTQFIAGAFAIAGIGAGMALFGVTGSGSRIELLTLAILMLAVAVGLWTELVAAWWTGIVVITVTILLSRLTSSPIGVGLIWPLALLGLVVVGYQGWRDQQR